MAYVTNSDIEVRLGSAAYVQVTDDNGDGSADVAVVDEARLGAESEVNSYLGRRYLAPVDVAQFPETAGVLKSITLDLIECRLRARRPPVPEEVLQKRDHAIAWLKGIADGSIAMPTAAELPLSTARGPIARASGEPKVLSHDELSGF